MKFIVLALLAWTAGATLTTSQDSVTPVQKVIQLLNGMLEKGKASKHQEQVEFAAYSQFCTDTSAQKSRAISEAAEQITILKANIQEFQAQASRLAQEIAQHEEDIATWGGDIKAAAKVRDIERADYVATHKDYSESLSAIAQAIAVLKDQAAPRAQATALLQAIKAFKSIPAPQRRTIDAFLSEDPEVGLEVSAPEANAYTFQSAPVIEMLEKLEDKFTTERTTLEKEEANSRHAHEMLTQDLQDSVTAAENSKTEKAQSRARNQQSAAQASGDLQDITSTKADDERYLADLDATCRSKTTDFEDRQNLRTQEITTIEKAIEILSSSAVSGAAETHLPAMMLQKARAQGTAFVQLRGQEGSPNQLRVAAFLFDQGSRLKSRVLSALAIRARDDPFAKVKKMINDLITRLMEQANEEADHKGWCDTELSTNEQTRREKSAAVENLHSEIDGLSSSIAQLGNQIADISQSIAEINAAVAKATALRQAERAKSEATIEDAQQAQSALAQAITVLQEFYATAGEATALVQQTKREEPLPYASGTSTPYTGMQGENTGVVGLLEVIQSDFARLEAETRAAEAASQHEFDRFATDSAVDKAQKEKDVEHKTAQRQSESQLLTEKRADLDTTQQELDAAVQYFDKLKPSCLETGTSYEDRVARRKEEIESLQEALRILNGEDLAAVQTSSA